MKIPKELNILGHIYQIKMVEDREFESGNSAPASSYARNTTIWVDLKQSVSQQEACIIHEIIEILNYHFELDLEHRKICCLEAGIYQVLKDNKLI